MSKTKNIRIGFITFLKVIYFLCIMVIKLKRVNTGVFYLFKFIFKYLNYCTNNIIHMFCG